MSLSSTANRAASSRINLSDEPLNMFERTAAILSEFVAGDTMMRGVSELSKSLRIPKTCVYRILSTLCDGGFIDFEESVRQYKLGPKVFELTLQHLRHIDGYELACQTLKELSVKTDETATLSVRVGDYRVHVEQVCPARSVNVKVTLGKPYPLHAGPSSCAFLAYLSAAEIHEILQRTLSAIDREADVIKSELKNHLELIGRIGYAVSSNKKQAGISAVAAPIFDRAGLPAMVMGVCGPTIRFESHIDEYGQLLLDSTRRLSTNSESTAT